MRVISGAAIIAGAGCSLLDPVGSEYTSGAREAGVGRDSGNRDAGDPTSGGAPSSEGGASSNGGGGAGTGAGGGAGTLSSGGRASAGGAAGATEAGGGASSGGVTSSGGRASTDAGREAGAAGGGAGCDAASCPCDAASCGNIPDVPHDGLLLWLRADRGVTQTNGMVEKWADQSGHGADAAQPVTLFRPRLVTAGGLPMLEFDGTDDQLGLPSGFSDFTAGVSLYAVAQAADDSTCGSVMHFSNGSEVDDVDLERNEMSLQYEVLDATLTGTRGAFESGRPLVLSATQTSAGAADLRVCALSVANGHFSLPAKILRTQNFIGKNLYGDCVQFEGRIAELLVYERALAPAEADQLESSLRARWGACQ